MTLSPDVPYIPFLRHDETIFFMEDYCRIGKHRKSVIQPHGSRTEKELRHDEKNDTKWGGKSYRRIGRPPVKCAHTRLSRNPNEGINVIPFSHPSGSATFSAAPREGAGAGAKLWHSIAVDSACREGLQSADSLGYPPT